MNAFLISSICLDRRPERRPLLHPPGVSVLVACYNEAAHIGETILSLSRQDFTGCLQVIILDDGSTDASVSVAREAIARAKAPARFSFHIVAGGPTYSPRSARISS